MIKYKIICNIFRAFLSLTPSSDEGKENIADTHEHSKSEENITHCTDTVGQHVNEVVEENIVQDNSFASNIPKDSSIDLMDETALKNQYMISIAQVNSEDCGVPMSIFDNVCVNIKYFLQSNCNYNYLFKYYRVICVSLILAYPTWTF